MATSEVYAFQQSLEPAYVFDVWQTEDGIPHSVVTSILQSDDGYLWMGTGSGLVRFDGIRFVTVYDERAPHLESNYVWTLWEDSDDVLWIGSANGLSRYQDRRFSTYAVENGLPNNFVRSLLRDSQGRLWVGTYGGGLCLFDETEGCTVYTTSDGLPDLFVNALLEDRNGVLWVGTDSGLSRLIDGRFETVAGLTEFREQIKALYEDKSGQLWIGTGQNIYRQMPDEMPVPLLANSVKMGTVRSIYEDHEGFLWIGTESAGLFRYGQGEVLQYTVGAGLSNNYIHALFQDREGSLWIGTDGGGLNRFKQGRVATFGMAEGLSTDAINSVYEDRQGSIWFGTNSGLSRLRNGVVQSWRESDGLADDRVLSLAENETGMLWVGTNGGGVSQFDGTRFTTLSVADGLPSDVIFSLHVDRQDRTWIGSTQGMSVWQEGELTNYGVENGLPPGLVVVICESPGGEIWVGGDGGLARKTDAGFERYTMADGLPNNAIRALYFDEAGMLWVGTRGGMARWDGSQFAAFTEEHGLPDEIVYHIEEDEQGHLWLNTARSGLVRVPKEQFNEIAAGARDVIAPLMLGRSDGMRSIEGVGGFQPAGLDDRDGRLWFLTHQGAVIVDPTEIIPDPLPPPVLIEEIVVDGEPLILSDEGVEIPYNTNRLEILYTGLSFLDPELVSFRHRLEGLENDWIYDGKNSRTRRTREYSRLLPGDYVFRVTAANRDGVWNNEIASLSILVPSPWWQTPLAYLLYFMLAGAGILGLVRWRVWSLKQRNLELENLVAERTEEVAQQAERLLEVNRMKSRFFANISHEFRTPLTLILGPLKDLIEEKNFKSKKSLLYGMQAQGNRLLELINQLLELSQLDVGGLKLELKAGEFVGFLRHLTQSFAPSAEKDGISLAFTSTTERLSVRFDHEKLQKVFVNLLSNALKFTESGGKVLVLLEERQGNVEVSIRDTGAGIPADELDRVFDRFYQTQANSGVQQPGSGIGLALSKELVQLHGGSIIAESTIGFGSVFTVCLSLEKVDKGETAPVFESKVNWKMTPSNDVHLPKKAVEEPIFQHSDDVPLVLIIDDNEDMRSFVRSCIDKQYRTVEAPGATAGMAQIAKTLPELVICDVMMPGIDGFEFCRRLKADERFNHIPVILLTAKASDEAAVEGLSAGADDYITKPFDAEVLRSRIRNQIETRTSMREKFSQELVLKPLDIPISSADEAFLQKTIETLERFIDDANLNVDLLADEMGMSRRHLQRKLREVTQQSPAEFIRNMRLERAAQLLQNKAGSIAEVAYAVGFKKPAHFSELFRKKYGISPSEYRT